MITRGIRRAQITQNLQASTCACTSSDHTVSISQVVYHNYGSRDNAERGTLEAIPFNRFPAVGTDSRIHWTAQNSFSGGFIEIGEERIPEAQLMRDGSKLVPAGNIVTVGSMDVFFTRRPLSTAKDTNSDRATWRRIVMEE
ncbi:hypothetical protein VTI28DRAFT_4361 [Corynascus sepedonium]